MHARYQGWRTAGRLSSLWGVYSDRSGGGGGEVFRQSGVFGAQTRDFRHVFTFTVDKSEHNAVYISLKDTDHIKKRWLNVTHGADFK